MHKSIYRRMHLRLGIDLDKGVWMGYYGTYNSRRSEYVKIYIYPK